MSLQIDGHKVAEGKAAGTLPVQPVENFCVGFDDRMPVGDYQGENRFKGKIENLRIK
jgi:hypothetical protein